MMRKRQPIKRLIKFIKEKQVMNKLAGLLKLAPLLANFWTTIPAVISLAVLVLQVFSSVASGSDVDWNVTIPAIFTAVSALFARQQNVSTEESK